MAIYAPRGNMVEDTERVNTALSLMTDLQRQMTYRIRLRAAADSQDLPNDIKTLLDKLQHRVKVRIVILLVEVHTIFLPPTFSASFEADRQLMCYTHQNSGFQSPHYPVGSTRFPGLGFLEYMNKDSKDLRALAGDRLTKMKLLVEGELDLADGWMPLITPRNVLLWVAPGSAQIDESLNKPGHSVDRLEIGTEFIYHNESKKSGWFDPDALSSEEYRFWQEAWYKNTLSSVSGTALAATDLGSASDHIISLRIEEACRRWSEALQRFALDVLDLDKRLDKTLDDFLDSIRGAWQNKSTSLQSDVMQVFARQNLTGVAAMDILPQLLKLEVDMQQAVAVGFQPVRCGYKWTQVHQNVRLKIFGAYWELLDRIRRVTVGLRQDVCGMYTEYRDRAINMQTNAPEEIIHGVESFLVGIDLSALSLVAHQSRTFHSWNRVVELNLGIPYLDAKAQIEQRLQNTLTCTGCALISGLNGMLGFMRDDDWSDPLTSTCRLREILSLFKSTTIQQWVTSLQNTTSAIGYKGYQRDLAKCNDVENADFANTLRIIIEPVFQNLLVLERELDILNASLETYIVATFLHENTGLPSDSVPAVAPAVAPAPSATAAPAQQPPPSSTAAPAQQLPPSSRAAPAQQPPTVASSLPAALGLPAQSASATATISSLPSTAAPAQQPPQQLPNRKDLGGPNVEILLRDFSTRDGTNHFGGTPYARIRVVKYEIMGKVSQKRHTYIFSYMFFT